MIKYDPGSDSNWIFVYEKLKKLTPTSDMIPGERLFCYDDFVGDINNDVKKSLVRKARRRI